MNRRLLLLVLIGGCYTGAELCAKHKWGYTQTVVGDGNGRYCQELWIGDRRAA